MVTWLLFEQHNWRMKKGNEKNDEEVFPSMKKITIVKGQVDNLL